MRTTQWHPQINALTPPLCPSVFQCCGNAGSVSADKRLRIQVNQDLHGEQLIFSLIALKDDSDTGAEIPVAGNGTYTLPDFSGSAVNSLEIRGEHYIAIAHQYAITVFCHPNKAIFNIAK